MLSLRIFECKLLNARARAIFSGRVSLGFFEGRCVCSLKTYFCISVGPTVAVFGRKKDYQLDVIILRHVQLNVSHCKLHNIMHTKLVRVKVWRLGFIILVTILPFKLEYSEAKALEDFITKGDYSLKKKCLF